MNKTKNVVAQPTSTKNARQKKLLFFKRWLAKKKRHTQRQRHHVVSLLFRPNTQVEQTMASTNFRVLTLMPELEPLSRTRSVPRAHFHAESTSFNPKSEGFLCLSVSLCVRFCVSVSFCACSQAFTRESAKDTANDHVHNRCASRKILVTSGGSRNRTDRERCMMDFTEDREAALPFLHSRQRVPVSPSALGKGPATAMNRPNHVQPRAS